MKQLFIFAIGIHYVICRWTVNERQWLPEDARTNCSSKCNEECFACTLPKKCNDNQIKCGEKSPEVHPDCPPDEICVPIGCNCK